MAGVDRLQKGRGLRPANLPKKQAVGPQTQTGLQQVLNGNLRLPLPAFGGQHGQPVGLRRVEFARVLDRNHPLARREPL